MTIAVSLPDNYMAILRVNRMFWILPFSIPLLPHIIQGSSDSSVFSVINVSVVKSKNRHKMKPWFTLDQIKVHLK